VGTTLRVVLGFLGSVACSLFAALVAWKLATWLAGSNVSDVGVRMYARGPLAVAAGLGGYLALVAGGLLLAARTARTARATSLTLFALGLGAAVVFLGFAALLLFEYA
jgi:hypothetical protein